MEGINWAISNRIMRIGRMRHHILEGSVGEMGVMPSQHYLLMQLFRMGRAFSQAEVAEELHVSPASVARTIKGLDAGGYIFRSLSDSDGRRNEIRLTDKGERVVLGSKALFDELDEVCYRGFSPEELENLNALLERVLENLSLKMEENCKRR